MEMFIPKKQHMREVLLYFFQIKKTAAESYRLLVDAYGEHALAESTCREWFRKFKNNDFDVEDKERSGAPKKFQDAELEALLDEDPFQTEKGLATALNVTIPCISQRLHGLGMVQKHGNWVRKDPET